MDFCYRALWVLWTFQLLSAAWHDMLLPFNFGKADVSVFIVRPRGKDAKSFSTVLRENSMDAFSMLSWIGNLETTPRHFLFLDRDGVINWDRRDYVKSWGEFEFCPDTLSALRHLYQQHVGVIVVSNQSALHRGYIEWTSFWHMHRQMIHQIREAGGDILAAFYCPHRPDERCSCRKPSPGMLWGAARLFGVTLQSAVMIGDRSTDVLAARNAGCRAVLLDRVQSDGNTSGIAAPASNVPDDRFPSLLDAVLALFGDAPT